MDPVTGLSRRQQIAIGVLIPFAIAASTVATLVDERGDDVCPDEAYDCVKLEPGEPIEIGIVDAALASEASLLSDLRAQPFAPIRGHPVELDLRSAGCSPAAAAEEVRELASDPPDEPPSVLVIATACDETAVPMAQILSDSGVTLVMLDDGLPIPTAPPYDLLAPEPGGLEAAPSTLEAALDVVERLAIGNEDLLVIPRTPLRDALVAEGYRPAP